MDRQELIRLLAQLVIRSNIENYKQMVEESGVASIPDFTSYGTDTETVMIIVKDLVDEVSTFVEEQQTLMAPIIVPLIAEVVDLRLNDPT